MNHFISPEMAVITALIGILTTTVSLLVWLVRRADRRLDNQAAHYEDRITRVTDSYLRELKESARQAMDAIRQVTETLKHTNEIAAEALRIATATHESMEARRHGEQAPAAQKPV